MKKILLIVLFFAGASLSGKAQTVAMFTSGGSADSYIHWMPLASQNSGSSTVTQQITDNFNIYPNPCSDFINITGDFSMIKIFDSTGKQIIATTKKRIDLSGLKQGTYLIKAGKNSKKFVKK